MTIEYRTIDGNKPAPYPNMTDADLVVFERDLNVPSPAPPTGRFSRFWRTNAADILFGLSILLLVAIAGGVMWLAIIVEYKP